MTSDPHRTYLSDEASKLKMLIQQDDERRRRAFIRNISEKHSSTEKPPRDAILSLEKNQVSVEYQLQEQVNFYQNALAKLDARSQEISAENRRLYDAMNKSVTIDASPEVGYKCGRSEKCMQTKPKERLLRTKGERTNSQKESIFNINEQEDSFEEPGQIMPGQLFHREPNDETEEFSYASEPGQIVDVFNHAESSKDLDDSRKVTFDIANPLIPQTDVLLATSSVPLRGHVPLQEPAPLQRPASLQGPVPLQGPVTLQGTKEKENIFSANDTLAPVEESFKLGVVDHGNLQEEMKRMQDVYETKSKHLDGLLKTAKKQVEEQQMEIINLKGELKMYKTPVKDETLDAASWKPEFLKPSDRNLVHELLQERDELFEAIKRQQTIVAEGNRHETEAYYHVKKSCEMVEQVQLEKQEIFVRAKQLEKDLEEYKEKYLIQQKDHQEEIMSVSRQIRQDMDITIEELNKKVEEQAVNLTVLENHLEKSIREKMDLKNELDKFERHNVNQQTTSTAMIEESQKEVMEALKRQTLAEHETGQIRLEAKLREKRKQQEVEQLSLEVSELKRRLHITEENLNDSQTNQLDITNMLNSTKQQLHQEQTQRKMMMQSFEDERKRFKADSHQREEDLTQIIQESEKCYHLAKEELTRLLESQTHLVNRYQNECKELSDRLSSERKQYQMNTTQLSDKCNQLEANIKEAYEEGEKKDALLDDYKQRIDNTMLELKQKKEMIMMLMSKQSAILRDRYLLSKEVELLKSQLPPPTLDG